MEIVEKNNLDKNLKPNPKDFQNRSGLKKIINTPPSPCRSSNGFPSPNFGRGMVNCKNRTAIGQGEG
jgi:hypothetical protein